MQTGIDHLPDENNKAGKTYKGSETAFSICAMQAKDDDVEETKEDRYPQVVRPRVTDSNSKDEARKQRLRSSFRTQRQ